MKTLSQRKSERVFKAEALSKADLSDLLWAASGVSRPDGKLTAPTALNKQEITVYAFLPTGVYRYDAPAHTLVRVAEGDQRKLLNGGQNFADRGALGLLYVGDASVFSYPEEQRKMTVAMDAAIVCQNVNLFCAAIGLSNVPRISMDKQKISALLKLKNEQYPLMNNVIGYKK